MCQFKAKNSELINYPFLGGNILKVFSVGDIKHTGLNEYVYDSFGSISTGDIQDIHK